MKTKFIYLTVSLLILTTSAKSQIEDLIISYIDTTEFVVKNGRRLILQSIIDKDYKKAREVYQYLDEKTEKDEFKAFGYYESIYINMLIHDWETWSELAKYYYKYSKAKIHKNTPKIEKKLYKLVVENNDIIEFSIKSADIHEETKNVALLLQYYLKEKVRNDKYNKMLDDFHSTYKSSEYNLFIKRMLPSKSKKFSWGVGAGTSYLYLFGNISKTTAPSNLISISTSANIGKIFIAMDINVGVFQLKNELSASIDYIQHTFAKGEYLTYTETSILSGYSVFGNDRIHVIPYLKLASSSLQIDISPDPELFETVYLLSVFNGGPGLHAELKLFEFGRKKAKSNHRNNYLSVKLQGGYNFNSATDIKELQGSSAYGNIGLVFGGGRF